MTGANHPMVPVQDAIRTVLYQTACVLMETPIPSKAISVHAPWNELLHQTLTAEVRMVEPGYPRYDASIMDGYAIRSCDYKANQKWCIHAKVFAGDPVQTLEESSTSLPTAVYVTTGAMIPDTFDCVVPVEHCTLHESKHLELSQNAVVEEGKWIRKVGCDTPAGSVVLECGHALDSSAIGLLLQLGISEVQIRSSIKVGVLSTGNELLGPNDDARVGKIPDVNRPVLLSLLSTFGAWCIPVDLGIHRDDNISLLTESLQSALEGCHVIISTGGISMGERDVMEHVLVDQLDGKILFGRLHMKPGKPTTFATISKPGRPTRLFFAMPGNPVSAVVCTHLLVKPCLDLLHHGADQTADLHGEDVEGILQHVVDNAWLHPEVTATLEQDAELDKVRPEYHRVTLTIDKDGKHKATTTGVQRSSRLMSMRDAQGLLLLPVAVTSGKLRALKGEEYTVLLLKDDPFRRVRVRDSLHMKKMARKLFSIGVVHVLWPGAEKDDKLEAVADQVLDALSGTKSGPVTIASSRTFSGKPEELLDFLASEDSIDLYVVICASYPGSFRDSLNISTELCKWLEKVADALAIQVRRGAASEDATSALFESVVGYAPNGKGTMLVCLSDRGLTGGLQNVRGLLNHALQVARQNQEIHFGTH